ncbi:MAG: hypothetical protein JXR73_11505 [Candidatus Omnitrophica bacterium]|nr:hypothetical protein [Candidatus Omnitrophota bacterium]
MQMKLMKFLGFLTAIGLLISGCATTSDNDIGSYQTPSRLWWDDLAFHANEDGVPPDWSIIDLSQESFGNWGNDWTNVQSDFYDVMR